MKHFVFFTSTVFVVLFVLFINKKEKSTYQIDKPVVRIFGYSSFTGAWGPGPILKEMFEKTCQCKIEYLEASDSSILLQRLKLEGQSLGADLLIGLDQFDLSKALKIHSWQKIEMDELNFESEIQSLIKNEYFIPYDWGYLAFMGRKSVVQAPPTSLDDLLDERFSRRIAFQDPRTSSPGLQFLWWIFEVKDEASAREYLKKIFKNAHSFSSSWTQSIGLFNRSQVDLVFTYSSSPIYYLLTEKSEDYKSYELIEPAPLQIEFAGIPEFCRQCDLAVQFVNLMLSPEGQKVIMEKNFMLPVIRGVKEGTPFSTLVQNKKTLQFRIPSESEVEQRLKIWSDVRKALTQ